MKSLFSLPKLLNTIQQLSESTKQYNTFLAIKTKLVRMSDHVAKWSYELYKEMLKYGSSETAGHSKEEVELDWVDTRA